MGDRYTIIVADLAGDDGAVQAKHVVRSLKNFHGVDIYRVPKAVHVLEAGDARQNLLAAQTAARELARRYNGDLVIWGDVLKSDQLLNLRVTARRQPATHDADYSLDTQLKLSANFGSALAALLFIECITRHLPALEDAKVGAINDLARETQRLQTLMSSVSLSADDRRSLAKTFTMAALTLFECTADNEWLRQAMMSVEDDGGKAHPNVDADELTFHARLWLVAADQMPNSELTMTALTWLDRAVEASNAPRPVHWYYKGWGLRLLSRLQADIAVRQRLHSEEEAIWAWLLTRNPSPKTGVDLKHLSLGIRRESAVSTGDALELRAIAAEQLALPEPTGSAAAIDLIQTLVEHGTENGDRAALERAFALTQHWLTRKEVVQSTRLADLLTALALRCEIQTSPLESLPAIETRIDSWQPAGLLNGAVRCVAEAELHLRLAPLEDTSLKQLKRYVLAKLSAVTAKKLLNFKEFHVLELLARRRWDIANDAVERLKATLDKQTAS